MHVRVFSLSVKHISCCSLLKLGSLVPTVERDGPGSREVTEDHAAVRSPKEPQGAPRSRPVMGSLPPLLHSPSLGDAAPRSSRLWQGHNEPCLVHFDIHPDAR